jgi:hypothetical protein
VSVLFYPIRGRRLLVAFILFLRPWPATISSGDALLGRPASARTPHKPRIANFVSPSSLFTLTDLCADCKTRNPRWASHNLGIFIWYAFSPPSLSNTYSVQRELRQCSSKDRNPYYKGVRVFYRRRVRSHKYGTSRKSLTMDVWTKEQVEVRKFHQWQGSFEMKSWSFS